MSKILFSASPVPGDQVERLQARCDEAFAAEPAGASAGIGAGTSQDTSATPGGSTDGGDANASSSTDTDVDFATLDLATVTAEACRAGGFTPSTAN